LCPMGESLVTGQSTREFEEESQGVLLPGFSREGLEPRLIELVSDVPKANRQRPSDCGIAVCEPDAREERLLGGCRIFCASFDGQRRAQHPKLQLQFTIGALSRSESRCPRRQ